MTAAVSVATKAAEAAKGATSAAAKGTKAAGARTAQGARAGAGSAMTEADRQRAGVQAIKDARPAAPANPVTAAAGSSTPQTSAQLPDALTDNRGAPSWWGSPDPVRAGNAGGGFLLGLGAWVLVRTYLDGGPTGVKNLLRAKFFNQVDG